MKNACVDCEFYRFENWDGFSVPYCTHPMVDVPLFDNVNGWYSPRISCGVARMKDHLCPQGIHFKQKISKWKKFKTFFLTFIP